ncbi:hypothetical protein Tco_0776960 [Tanacetum coccineum]
MSTQQDIYDAGSETRPPMLNKENYVPWLSRLLHYAKSKPNGKLIYNSIMNAPYVRRMIPKPEANDQAFQTILLGPPEDIYAAIDSCETAQEIWLRVQQMMKVQSQNLGVSNVESELGLFVVFRELFNNSKANQNRNGNVVTARAEGNEYQGEGMMAGCSLVINNPKMGRSATPTTEGDNQHAEMV